MKRVLWLAALILFASIMLFALLGWKASYRETPLGRRDHGVWFHWRSGGDSYVVYNRRGWTSLHRFVGGTVPSAQLLVFPWWKLALATSLLTAGCAFQIYRLRSRSIQRGFSVDSTP